MLIRLCTLGKKEVNALQKVWCFLYYPTEKMASLTEK